MRRHHFIRSGRFKSFANQTETLIRYAQNKRELVSVVNMQSNPTTTADVKARAVGLIPLNIIKTIQLTSLFAMYVTTSVPIKVPTKAAISPESMVTTSALCKPHGI
jgi:hypothetical protein